MLFRSGLLIVIDPARATRLEQELTARGLPVAEIGEVREGGERTVRLA